MMTVPVKLNFGGKEASSSSARLRSSVKKLRSSTEGRKTERKRKTFNVQRSTLKGRTGALTSTLDVSVVFPPPPTRLSRKASAGCWTFPPPLKDCAYCEPVHYFCPAEPVLLRSVGATTPWCNGNTGVFEALIHGSNPCGVATFCARFQPRTLTNTRTAIALSRPVRKER